MRDPPRGCRTVATSKAAGRFFQRLADRFPADRLDHLQPAQLIDQQFQGPAVPPLRRRAARQTHQVRLGFSIQRLCEPASERVERVSVASAPSRTNFCRIRTTWRSEIPTASAISQSRRRPSGWASSAINKILAHRTRDTPADDCRTTLSNSLRATADNFTLCFSDMLGILAWEFDQKPCSVRWR